MITLKSLKLSGFKSIKDTTPRVEFGDLNILVGANGSGKSNLLSFFGMLNYLTNESLQKYIGVNGGPESLLHYGTGKTRELSAQLEFATEAGINTYQMTLAVARSRVTTLIFTEESVNFCATGMPPREEPMALGFGHTESSLMSVQFASNQTVSFFKRALRGFRFYQFNDSSDESPLRKDRAEVRNVRPFHSDGANLPAVLFYLKENHLDVYSQIVNTVRRLVPYFRNFEFERIEGRAPESDVLVSWIAEGQDYRFGMHQLSDGTVRFIALATLLLLPEGLMPEGAILIDEPELGLHPRGLTVLASLLRSASKRVQIICTTQSSDFLNEFDPIEVIVVEHEDGSTFFNRLSTAKFNDWFHDKFTLGDILKKNLIAQTLP